MSNQNVKKKYSPGLIFICFFICYPVAIFMIIYNISHSVKNEWQNSQTASYVQKEQTAAPVKRKPSFLNRVMRFIGYFLAAVGIITIATMIPNISYNISGFISVFMFLVVGGGILIFISQRSILKDKRRNRYVDIINNTGDHSIVAIAQSMGRPRRLVLADIQEMLDDGYFPHCSIDRGRMEFCLPKVSSAAKYDYHTVAITCASCGAKTAILSGTVVKCEYCGCPLIGK